MDNKDCVIDHRADQNNKSKHGQDIKTLGLDKSIDCRQPDKSTRGSKRDGKENNKRVDEIFKEGRKQQVGDQQGQKQIPFQSITCLNKLIGIAANGN